MGLRRVLVAVVVLLCVVSRPANLEAKQVGWFLGGMFVGDALSSDSETRVNTMNVSVLHQMDPRRIKDPLSVRMITTNMVMTDSRRYDGGQGGKTMWELFDATVRGQGRHYAIVQVVILPQSDSITTHLRFLYTGWDNVLPATKPEKP